MDESNNVLLESRNLNISIGGQRICQNLNIQLVSGQRWAILGVNGIGKTTLIHSLAGLRKPQSGKILLGDDDIRILSRRKIAQTIGLLLQDSVDPFPVTVLETALIGRHPFLNPWQWESKSDIEQAKEALAKVGLHGLEQRMTSTLSGGERRRLALATLLIQDPLIYLLDEPTNHLDLNYQIAILDLLSDQVKARKKVSVMILHDINLANRFCDHVLLLLGNGESMSGPTDEVLNCENLHRVYNHPMTALAGPSGMIFLPQ